MLNNKFIVAVLFFLCIFTVYVMGTDGADTTLDIQKSANDILLQIYALKYADTHSIKDTLNDIYAGDNTIRIAASMNKLFIRASAKQHEEIKMLLKDLDVKQKNVRIEVKFTGNGDDSAVGAGVESHGNAVYHNGEISGNVSLTPSIYSQSSSISENTMQILMVMSGSHAELRVGTRVPYLTWLMDYGYHCGIISSEMHWEDVGSFLSVEPDIIGDGPMVKVKLVPVLSGLVDGHRGKIRFVQEATEVVVRSGNTVTIGGTSNNKEFLSRFLIGFDKRGRSYALNIKLRPIIMN